MLLYRGRRRTDPTHPLLTYTKIDMRLQQGFVSNPQPRVHGISTFMHADAVCKAVRTISADELQIYSLSDDDPEFVRPDKLLYTHHDKHPHVSIRPFFSGPLVQMSKDDFETALLRIRVNLVEMKGQGEDSPEEDNFGPSSIRALKAYGRELISDAESVNEGLFCRVAAVLMEEDDSWLSAVSLSRKEIDLLCNALASYRRQILREAHATQSMPSADINYIAELNTVVDFLHEKIPSDDCLAGIHH